MSASRLEDRLIGLARTTPWFIASLAAVRDLRLASWCIGAGAVRNLVWDALHEKSKPSALSDVDVAYFDSDAMGDAGQEPQLQRSLQLALPCIPWEVTNQARVHHWFAGHFGHEVDPLPDLEAAVASWPEYATSVGLTLNDDDSITVIAPHGLDDLFAMIVRRNPTRVSVETYRQRVEQKRYVQRWPRVTVTIE